MGKSIPHWQLGGFVFTSIAGTLLHFLFDFSGGSAAAALISAVNESIWEHMKLLYVPMLMFAGAEYRVWGREVPGFWCIKLGGFLRGLVLVPVLYYTYTGALGISADWFNITIFFLSALFVYRWETLRLNEEKTCRLSGTASLLLVLLIGVLFLIFTFRAPQIPLFRDPVTGTYGFSG